ncbi:MAG: hypothetical protein O2913_07140 [Chloroflexi bacterium]|nr:hypothetical protein [Chloroflexota bacterium]
MEKVDLERYEITGRLGSGADYEVRAAIDRETGQQVAIKRPVPQAISRNQHAAIEARTEKILQAYQEVGNSTPLISPILGYTEPATHDGFFGDELGQEYQVMVEERARGIPLLGDMMSKFKGIPIGAGQNLFPLFPLVQTSSVPAHPVHNQLLDLEEVFLKGGYVLLDLRPQNIFYQPGNGQMVVIDFGALAKLDGEAPRGRPPFDVNDACLEILKFYTTPSEPPTESSGYRDPRGIRPIVNIGQELDEMARDLAECPPLVADAGTAILDKVRTRSYTGYSQFRADLTSYLDRIAERNAAMANAAEASQAWLEAAQWLKEDYWRGFLFDPDIEMAGYVVSGYVV